MGIRYQFVSRRRRVLVVTPNPPASSAVIPSPGSGRVHIAPVVRRPAFSPVSRITIASTTVVTGAPVPPPPTGGGGSPKPLQPHWIGVNVAWHPKPRYQAVVHSSIYVQPAIDGLPNDAVVVSQTRPHSPPRNAVIHSSIRSSSAQVGGRDTSVVVRVPPRGPRLKGIVTVLPGGVFEELDAFTNPIVVSVPRVRQNFIPSVIRSRYDVTKQISPSLIRPVVAICQPRPRRLKGILMILPGDAFELVPPLTAAPHIVRYNRNPAIGRVNPIVYSSKVNVSYRAIPGFAPLVVPVPCGYKSAPWVFTSQFLKFTVPDPVHDPRPHPLFVEPRRRQSQYSWPKPVVTTSILQPDGERYDKPWDLIAACIAWLRSNGEIVSVFGDVKGSEKHQKFVSDVELPRTDAPYVVFSEPREIEMYESKNSYGLKGSTIQGIFQIQVVMTEKLLARQYADEVAASLQDAPLKFTDGILLYLRRTERRFPSFKATGHGGDVTLYKRIVEFEYFIERYF